MKRLDNKGFTLTELLATLAVLSLVSTIVIYVAINVVNSAKDKSYLVTRNNVEKAAVSYLEENSDKIHFVKYKDNIEYQCVTVQNLIDTNYFDKDVLNSKISKDKTISDSDYIYIERDKKSRTIKNSKLITDSDRDYSTICGNYNSRLDGDIEFKIPGGYAKEKDVLIKYCLYNVSDYKNIEYLYNYVPSDKSSFIREYDEDNCLVKNIKILSNGELTAEVKDTDIKKSTSITGIDNKAPVIKIEPNGDDTYTKSKTININISDDLSGISSDSTIKYGFSKSKSEEPGSYKEINVSTSNVKVIESSLTGEYYLWIKPSVKDNVGNENNDTLISDVYKFDNTAPSIPTYIAKYREGSGSYTSGSNANKEVVTEISTTEADSGIEGIYYSKNKRSETKFNFGVSALTQNGSTWSGTESWDFRNGRNDSYYFRACDKAGNCSEWSNVFNIKYITSVYIKYNANGGSMASSHGSGYGVNSDGMIIKNGSILTTKVNYKGKLGNNGLYNTNNSNAVNLENGSYSIFSGREWCTNSSGSATCYDQKTQYNASDFCDASSSDCEVTLYANWLSYYCSYTKKSYPTKSEAVEACTITTTKDVDTTTTTTYSCPAGYTCSGGTCTENSTCEKIVTGTISKKYYCSHDGTYQSSSNCSYVGGYYDDYYNLNCVNGSNCTSSCPDGSTLKNGKCYKYDKTSCGSGWSAKANGYCAYTCGYSTGLKYSHCTVNYKPCQSNPDNYSCTSTCGSNDTSDCVGGFVIRGSNPYANCKTDWKYYTCSKNATKSCNKVYKAGSKSNTKTNGSCASGYTAYRGTGCSKKIIKDGKEYCDTRQYWTGKSCTSDYSGGSTNRVDMKCTKTGELKYYCSITGKYTTSKPSCTDTEKENLISTTTTSYSCPTGYDSTGNLDKNSVCTKTVVYDVY